MKANVHSKDTRVTAALYADVTDCCRFFEAQRLFSPADVCNPTQRFSEHGLIVPPLSYCRVVRAEECYKDLQVAFVKPVIHHCNIFVFPTLSVQAVVYNPAPVHVLENTLWQPTLAVYGVRRLVSVSSMCAWALLVAVRISCVIWPTFLHLNKNRDFEEETVCLYLKLALGFATNLLKLDRKGNYVLVDQNVAWYYWIHSASDRSFQDEAVFWAMR